MAWVIQENGSPAALNPIREKELQPVTHELTVTRPLTSFFSEYGGGGAAGGNPTYGYSTSG